MWPAIVTPETPFRQRVHYTLAYGNLDDFRRLRQSYPEEQIKAEFAHAYPGIYSKAKFGFYRAYFGLTDLPSTYYIKYV